MKWLSICLTTFLIWSVSHTTQSYGQCAHGRCAARTRPNAIAYYPSQNSLISGYPQQGYSTGYGYPYGNNPYQVGYPGYYPYPQPVRTPSMPTYFGYGSGYYPSGNGNSYWR